jgi:hypothetical protein
MERIAGKHPSRGRIGRRITVGGARDVLCCASHETNAIAEQSQRLAADSALGTDEEAFAGARMRVSHMYVLPQNVFSAPTREFTGNRTSSPDNKSVPPEIYPTDAKEASSIDECARGVS